MGDERGSAEIIGIILLIGVIIGAFGIFTALYIPSLIPDRIPQVKLNVACGDSDITGTGEISDYPCARGAFGCHPFDNRSCEEDCKNRDYADNPQYNSENPNLEVLRCMENCVGSMCSDLSNCKIVYICHNGGDGLKISDLKMVINGKTLTNSATWKLKRDDTMYPDPYDKQFQNGDLLLIPNPYSSESLDTVMIIYNLSSGRGITLVMNQYGTYITK